MIIWNLEKNCTSWKFAALFLISGGKSSKRMSADVPRMLTAASSTVQWVSFCTLLICFGRLKLGSNRFYSTKTYSSPQTSLIFLAFCWRSLRFFRMRSFRSFSRYGAQIILSTSSHCSSMGRFLSTMRMILSMRFFVPTCEITLWAVISSNKLWWKLRFY